MNDSDFRGPSPRWILIGAALIGLISGPGMDYLLHNARTGVRITMIPDGSYCTGPGGERLASVRHDSGAEVTMIPAGARCYNPDGTPQ